MRRDPYQPNLRQVHLIHTELLDEARAAGHDVGPGSLGETILTADLDLLALPINARLLIGGTVLRVAGLRNPCRQINEYSAGLLKVVVAHVDGVASTSDVTLRATGGAESVDDVGIVRKAGVMAVIEHGGEVRPGMLIDVVLVLGLGDDGRTRRVHFGERRVDAVDIDPDASRLDFAVAVGPDADARTPALHCHETRLAVRRELVGLREPELLVERAGG